MVEEDIVLSVCVPTYNHEKYIKKALDSIYMQKTDFKFEVLVGEDCSTDNTRQVIQKFEEEHPGFLTVFYREENMNNLPVYNSLDLKLRTRGRYIVILEGDDFWTDELKLQKQVSFLEEHPEYTAVAHRCYVVDENSEKTDEEYPQAPSGDYSFSYYKREMLPGQLTTFVSRNYFNDKKYDPSVLKQNLTPLDKVLYLYSLMLGKVYCMPDVMSAYRHIIKGGASFSANYRFNLKYTKYWYSNVSGYFREKGRRDFANGLQMLYFLELRTAVKRKQLSLKEFLKEIVHSSCWPYILVLLFERDVIRLIKGRSFHLNSK